MISFTVPPAQSFELAHLCLDLNGTICFAGQLIEGVAERLRQLAPKLTIHVITADTNNNALPLLEGLPVSLHVIPAEAQGQAKANYIKTLGASHVVAMGNGFNDRCMLAEAALSVAVAGREGMACGIATSATLLCTSITDALDLLLFPERLVATLRD